MWSGQRHASWDDLCNVSHLRFNNLVFADDSFFPLVGTPFAQSAAECMLVWFEILERLSCAFDGAGKRTSEGHRIFRDYFTRQPNPLFSDSSQTEKHRCRDQLTFRHPQKPGDFLFCTWHGKVHAPVLRVHYWWSADKPETRFMWCTLGPRSLDDKHGERPAAALQPVLRRFAQQHRTLGGFAVDDQVRGEVGRPVRSCVPQEQASGAARTSRTQGERQEHAIDMANIARVLARIGRRRHCCAVPCPALSRHRKRDVPVTAAASAMSCSRSSTQTGHAALRFALQ